MITVYGYTPAWGLPDISPYVTKLVNYMTFAGIDHQWQPQNLATLDEDSPFGKLPYINDDGTKVGDSNRIIIYLKEKYGDPLDGDQSPVEAAQALAFNRLVEEHLYWSGVIQPRWRYEDQFEIYIPYIVQGADVGPELRAALMAFRDRIMDEFNGQGMGRRLPRPVTPKGYDVYLDDRKVPASTTLGELGLIPLQWLDVRFRD